MDVDDEDDADTSDEDEDAEPKLKPSLVVTLRYGKDSKSPVAKPEHSIQDSITVQPLIPHAHLTKAEPVVNGIAALSRPQTQPVHLPVQPAQHAQHAQQAPPPIVPNSIAFNQAPAPVLPQSVQPQTALPPFPLPADAPIKQYHQAMNVPITSHEPSQTFQNTVLPPNPATAYGWQ
jgi:hypothetical protein